VQEHEILIHANILYVCSKITCLLSQQTDQYFGQCKFYNIDVKYWISSMCRTPVEWQKGLSSETGVWFSPELLDGSLILSKNLRQKIHNKTTISCICKDHNIHTIQTHFIRVWSWEQYIHLTSYSRLPSPYLTSHTVINPAYITMRSYLLSCLYKVQKHTTWATYNIYS